MLNLTQHRATPDQIAQGVEQPDDGLMAIISALLTFNELPTPQLIDARAQALAALAHDAGATAVMIGGAPWLMRPLEAALSARSIRAAYAFSSRVSEEVQMPDGGVRKVQIFRHEGFIWA